MPKTYPDGGTWATRPEALRDLLRERQGGWVATEEVMATLFEGLSRTTMKVTAHRLRMLLLGTQEVLETRMSGRQYAYRLIPRPDCQEQAA